MARLLVLVRALFISLLCGCGSYVGTPQDAAVDSRSIDASQDADGGPPSSQACGADVGFCNPVGPGNCPNGQGCSLSSNGSGGMTFACAPSGTGGWDAPCPTGSECGPGFICTVISGASGPRCRKSCCAGDTVSCYDPSGGGRAGTRCSGIFGPSFPSSLRFCADPVSCGLSLGSCNPLDRSTCPSGQMCTLFGSGSTATFRCTPEMGGVWGEACNSSTPCGAGFLCSREGRCQKLCCYGDDASCADPSAGGHAGARCSGGFSGPPVLTGLGWCSPL